MAALHGRSPPPYTFVSNNQNFLPKICSKSVVYGPDPLEDALKRPITTIPPSITTTYHDGGLPSPLSCVLVNYKPLLPSLPTQHLRQNMRERSLFQNNGWTKWKALQLTDELKVKQEMVKADWECWTKLETQFQQIHGPSLLDTDDKDQDDACQDKRIEQR